MTPLANSFPLFGYTDDSNSQSFASGYFSHSQIIKITRIFRVCERKFRAQTDVKKPSCTYITLGVIGTNVRRKEREFDFLA